VAHLAVSVDDLETNTRFAQSVEADYPILSDASKKVATEYGVLSPQGFARRWTFYIGPDGKIMFIDDKVSTATAGEDLAKKLAELGVKKKK
jgi:peroxiredoxin Q/BCP